MPLDAQAEDFLRRLAAANLPCIVRGAKCRRVCVQMDMSTLFGRPAHGRARQDREIPGPGGALRVRIITPMAAGEGPLPVVVTSTAGGWVLGNIASHEGICRAVANAGGVIVSRLVIALRRSTGFPPLRRMPTRRPAGPSSTPPSSVAIPGGSPSPATAGDNRRRDVPDGSQTVGHRR